MSVQRSTLVAGPAKLVQSGTAIFTVDDFQITPKLSMQDVKSSVHGLVDETQDDVTYECSPTPVSVWSYRSLLFPYIGNGTGGSESPRGARIFGDADTPLVITSRDGSSSNNVFTLLAAAITKMPDLYLGPTKDIFGPVTWESVVGNGLDPETVSSFMTITSGAYADATFDPTQVKRQRYSAAWSGAGFGAFQAQDFWTVQSELNVEPVKVQGYTRDMKINSMRFMAKCIPVGPTVVQIDAALRSQGTGAQEGRRLSGSAGDLVITGSGVSVALKNCNLKSAGYVFGGVALRNGELGWETTIGFAGGVATPQLVLS